MDETLLLSICVAGSVTLAVMFLIRLVTGRTDEKLRGRLATENPAAAAARDDVARQKSARQSGLVPLFHRIGQAAAKPFMPKERDNQSALRKKLGQAGIYSSSAMRLMIGCKVMLLVAGVGLGYLVGLSLDNLMLGLSLGGLIGYLLPTMWLANRIKANKRSLQLSLPDALDLMVVCIEAGLTVDLAMQRVGEELGLAHPALAREFGITHMETRVGLSRAEALKNLAQRTQSDALKSLAAMLIQADRFGTSIAKALRIHADTLRVQRQQQAEEMAARASVKMSFPLVLFIFPATFLILLGPIVLSLLDNPMFQ
jgi:tight adherence protein C